MTFPERRGAPERWGDLGPEPVPADGPGGGQGDWQGVVRVSTGRGGLPRVEVRSPTATAEVYLQGAQVTRWAPTGGRPVLWTGARSTSTPGRPLRGGVRVCFPSCDGERGDDGPVHGLVDDLPWTFTGWGWQSDDVVLTFALASAGPPAAAAPYGLRYTVTVGATLTLELRVTNTGPGPLAFEDGLHTHLAVADVREMILLGLDGLDRVDRRTGRRARTPAGAQLHVVAETDHVYDRPGAVTVVDWQGQRSVRVRAHGASKVVVRHPWADMATATGDLGTDEWSAMVGLVSGNVGDGAVVLAPGDQHTLVVSLDVGPLP